MNTVKIIIASLFLTMSGYAKGRDATGKVIWECILKRRNNDDGEIHMKAKLADGWRIYALGNNPKSPIIMNFNFSSNKAYQTIGEVTQPTPLSKYDDLMGMHISYFEQEVLFKQKVKIKLNSGKIVGKIEFMICNNQVCLPPQTYHFQLAIKK